MEPGAKLADGTGSEVYAWGDLRVVKLFDAGTDRRIVDYEAKVTRAAWEKGAPAPQVHEVIEVAGRPGIILDRFDGTTLLEAMIRGQITPAAAGEMQARVANAIHRIAGGPEIRTLREWARFNLASLRRMDLAADVVERVEEVLGVLPEAGVLCHGDLHPGNIMVTPAGPAAIDWISAIRADPLVDVARQHLTYTRFLVDERAAPPEAAVARWNAARSEIHDAFIATYAGLSGTTPDALLAAATPYDILMAAMRMVEPGCSGEERRLLEQYVRATHSTR